MGMGHSAGRGRLDWLDFGSRVVACCSARQNHSDHPTMLLKLVLNGRARKREGRNA
jgi:hypothetical protein